MKTILFYSFKGGVGRTQTLLNVAKYLAEEKKKKIAIVDFDLYAPGLSYLHNNQKTENTEYFLRYLVNLFEEKDCNIFKEELSENLSLIPAFTMKNIKPYHQLLTELSKYLYSVKSTSHNQADSLSTVADNIFDVIKSDIEKTGEYDYIFFDARTGLTEVSDILFSQYVDIKVIVSSYNNQNIDGTNDLLELLSDTKIKKHSILRILSPKPKTDRSDLISIKSKASLEDNPILRQKFNWIDTLEVHYEDEVVTNDFEVWEKIDKKSQYRQDIIDIANTLDDSLSESIL